MDGQPEHPRLRFGAVITLLRRPLLVRSKDGVAGTVGTIMALLVFLTFLSLITNQYVPVWMKDSEAAHMGDALGQFGQFKTSIDLQILVAHRAAIEDEDYTPVTTFSSVKLGVEGVPIFAVPTMGDLRANENVSTWNVAFNYQTDNATTVPESNCACGGSIRLQVFNRYYVPQTISYENGAIMRSQFDGQIVKGEPSFLIRLAENSVVIDFRLVELFVMGAGGVTGYGTEGLSARLIALDVQEYRSLLTNVDITARTLYGPAWYRFFNDTLARTFGITAAYYLNPLYFIESDLRADFDAGGNPLLLNADNPIYRIQSQYNSGTKDYSLRLEFKRDVGGDSIAVLPITAFHLVHAYVTVQVGSL